MDFIDEFLSIAEGFPSAPSFKLWAGIHTVAAALERRVYTYTDGPYPLCPNLYTILTGSPASGKTIMANFSKQIQVSLCSPKGGIYLGPDNPSSASFLDELDKSSKKAVNGMGSLTYCSMSVIAREFGSLMSKYDNAFATILGDLYDNPLTFSAPRRTSKSIAIEAPNVNLIACVTPDALREIIPEVSWEQGITSRLMFIYGSAPERYRDPIGNIDKPKLNTKRLEMLLREFYHELHGPFVWEPEPHEAFKHWINEERKEPIPEHVRLRNYNSRRTEHLMKLSMISAVAAGDGLTITQKSFDRAKTWLFDAEKLMPDVFRALVFKSDVQLLQDAHEFFWAKYNVIVRANRKPITMEELWDWFEDKVPHDKIEGLIETMEKTGRLRRTLDKAGFIPNPPKRGKHT